MSGETFIYNFAYSPSVVATSSSPYLLTNDRVVSSSILNKLTKGLSFKDSGGGVLIYDTDLFSGVEDVSTLLPELSEALFPLKIGRDSPSGLDYFFCAEAHFRARHGEFSIGYGLSMEGERQPIFMNWDTDSYENDIHQTQTVQNAIIHSDIHSALEGVSIADLNLFVKNSKERGERSRDLSSLNARRIRLADTECNPIGLEEDGVKNAKHNGAPRKIDEPSESHRERITRFFVHADPNYCFHGGQTTAPKHNAGGAVLLGGDSFETATGAKPLAQIIGVSTATSPPGQPFSGVQKAIRKCLKQSSLKSSDVQLWEIKESYPGIAVAAMNALNLDHTRVNSLGGQLAWGDASNAEGVLMLNRALVALTELDHEIAMLCSYTNDGVAICVLLRRCQ